MPVASICPHPSVFASYNTFQTETRLQKGETAFATVKRFRLAEKEKNAAGRRLWSGMKACRAKEPAKPKEPTDSTISDILSGGL